MALAALLAYLVSRLASNDDLATHSRLGRDGRAVSDRHDYSVRAPAADTLELDQLTEAFNHMLMQVENRREAHSRADESPVACCNTLPRPSAIARTSPASSRSCCATLRRTCRSTSARSACTTPRRRCSPSRRSAPRRAPIPRRSDLAEGSVVPIDENGLSRCVRGTAGLRAGRAQDSLSIPAAASRKASCSRW